MAAIPGLLSLRKAIKLAEATVPKSIAISAKLEEGTRTYAVLLFRTDKHDVVTLELDAMSGDRTHASEVR